MGSPVRGCIELVARYRAEGDAAFEPRSRRPKSSPTAIPDATVELIVELRRRSSTQGLDAGADTIGLASRTPPSDPGLASDHRPHPATPGLVTPAPTSGPALPMFGSGRAAQRDAGSPTSPTTALAAGDDVEILSWFDDHARYVLSITAHGRVNGPDRGRDFHAAIALHGAPASTLTDNGMVFTTRLSGGKAAATASSPNWLVSASPRRTAAPTIPAPAGRSSAFNRPSRTGYAPNPTSRPPSSSSKPSWTCSPSSTTPNAPTARCPSDATPAVAYPARPKATARRPQHTDTHLRVRHDRVDKTGRRHPAPQRPPPPHRPRREHARTPQSSYSSPTSTSASSTPPPASSSAPPRPSTQTTTTSPSASTRTTTAKPTTRPQLRVQACRDVLRHHSQRPGRIRTSDLRTRRPTALSAI